jgi:beta-glucosidase
VTFKPDHSSVFDGEIRELLMQMTLEEKIGQLSLVNGSGGQVAAPLKEAICGGRIGAVLNEVDLETVNELQRIAVEESRLGIPLLIGRDVIHGFKTVFPIPLGQAASWNPDIVTNCARIAALEAASAGVNWTFAPMIDIGRDPRWGRVAETLGEDPYLTGVLAAAMVRGFQGDDLAKPGNIAACAKHFAGYGASESGRDYNTTNIPENELRNVHLVPFKAALDAGAATFMTSFSDLNGVPATANELLLKRILRNEWRYEGFVVSDWDSVRQLSVHGLTVDYKDSAFEAANAGVDMEMASSTYADHLAALIEEGRISLGRVDTMVANVLRAKFRLGLFDRPYTDPGAFPAIANAEHLAAARNAALQSVVLLKNDDRTLPLSTHDLRSLAVIGPLADDPYEQLGTWVFDGDPQHSQTPLQAIRKSVGGSAEVRFARAMETTRSKGRDGFAEAIEVAKASDAVTLFLGEESILSGEAHCRADIGLPGVQAELIRDVAATGKPVVLVLMSGRPIAMESVVDEVDAILCAWHPGSMAGPAIADLLFGLESPSGKLPVTFPRVTGQIPIYYAHKNTGKPPIPETVIHIDDIERNAPQNSVGGTSFHLDAGHTPLFPFGYGLSYTEFEYRDIEVSSGQIHLGETIEISAELTNLGDREAEEAAQLYIRDLVGSVTRPVKELKGFQRIRLMPGETGTVTFELHTDDLAFYDRRMRLTTEPGKFHVWIGGSSDADLRSEFEIVDANQKPRQST